MILHLANFVLKDFIYKQNPDGSYILDPDGNLTPENMNDIIDTINYTLKEVYSGIVKKIKIDPGKIMCNDYLLEQACSSR